AIAAQAAVPSSTLFRSRIAYGLMVTVRSWPIPVTVARTIPSGLVPLISAVLSSATRRWSRLICSFSASTWSAMSRPRPPDRAIASRPVSGCMTVLTPVSRGTEGGVVLPVGVVDVGRVGDRRVQRHPARVVPRGVGPDRRLHVVGLGLQADQLRLEGLE